MKENKLSSDDVIKILEEELKLPVIAADSSNIVAFAYNTEVNALWVCFKGNKLYRYKRVPMDIYQGLLNAESKGKYINANIVKNKPFEFDTYEIH